MRKFFNPFSITLIIIAAVAGWYFMGSGKNKNAEQSNVLVSVTAATLKDVPLTIAQVGNVIAYETVAVRSRLDSQVMEVKFKDGEAVEKGAPLFQLDDRALKAQQNELLANINRDKAQLENLRLQYNRAQALTKQGFVSTATLDNAKAAYRAQQAIVAATTATLENVQVQLAYTLITAPISGRTGTINVTVGNNVKANDTNALVTINQTKPIRVQFSLPQQYFAPLRSAMQAGDVSVSATREGNATSMVGTLEYIDNSVNQSTGTFVVRAHFTNDEEALWPGMFVNLNLNLGDEKSVLTVPEVAVQHGQTGDYVFVIEGGKASKRDIKVGRLQQDMAVIMDGLKEGEQVAVDGIMSLKNDAAVTIKSDATTDAK